MPYQLIKTKREYKDSRETTQNLQARNDAKWKNRSLFFPFLSDEAKISPLLLHHFLERSKWCGDFKWDKGLGSWRFSESVDLLVKAARGIHSRRVQAQTVSFSMEFCWGVDWPAIGNSIERHFSNSGIGCLKSIFDYHQNF